MGDWPLLPFRAGGGLGFNHIGILPDVAEVLLGDVCRRRNGILHLFRDCL